MRRLLLALALLGLAPSAQAFDVSQTTWANKLGSMMDILSYSLPPYNFWSGGYYSNETTTPQKCRNYTQVLIVYKTPAQASAIWSLRFPPNVQRTFDIEIHAHSFQVGADCSEETVWAARIVHNPLRLCTAWIKRLPSGQVIQGNDIFWSIPQGSFATNGPYQWPRGYPVKWSSCRETTKLKHKNVAIPRAPKNYPVWPPIPDPGPIRR